MHIKRINGEWGNLNFDESCSNCYSITPTDIGGYPWSHPTGLLPLILIVPWLFIETLQMATNWERTCRMVCYKTESVICREGSFRHSLLDNLKY